MTDIEANVVIVGSGISGALLATKLAQAGVKVAILEAGARVERATARRRVWNAAIRVPECRYPPSPQAEHPLSNDPDYWYRQTGPDKFKSTYLKVVGGTTWHWLGTCLRFVPNDFRLASVYDRGVDWPIAYDELEPFYSRAEQEIGVSGDSSEALGSPRSMEYPMPAIPATFMDNAYARALAGTEFQVRSTPRAAIRSTAARGPPAAATRAASQSARSRRNTMPRCTWRWRRRAVRSSIRKQPPRKLTLILIAASPRSILSAGTAAKVRQAAESSCSPCVASRFRGFS
jgi:choline dehydrogenase-like flavoprotein